MRPRLVSTTSRTSWSTFGKNGHVQKVRSISLLLSPVADIRIDPENLLVMVQTWQNGDVSKQEPYNGDFEKAMSAIKAKTLVLPGKTDLYFP